MSNVSSSLNNVACVNEALTKEEHNETKINHVNVLLRKCNLFHLSSSNSQEGG
jgi:hypothetical protein